MRGPIDYIIVGFEGNKFDGTILQTIGDAIDKEIIDLVALALITKDVDGNVSTLDIANSGDSYAIEFTQKYSSDNSLVDQDDITEMADLLENNTSAGLLIVEQLWAKPLKQALINSNGVLVADGRIHPDAELELNEGDN
ncbi:MAG: DUF6325 family protein [Patescibacteria group bacterium]